MEFTRASILITSIILSSFNNFLVLGCSSPSHSENDRFLTCLTDQFERSNLATDVIHNPTNASYASLLQSPHQRVSSTSTQRPLLIITPFHESEIQATVLCSKRTNIQIRVRSGGHDYEGLSYTSPNPFVIVDMRNFRTVSIDSDEKSAWVQVGATLGQLYYTLAKKSKTLAFTAGVCPTVGVGGHFSGGGYSMMSRRHAIASDNIIDAILINADGQILDRESMGDDLFWAIRGGGGTSFGIVISFKVNLLIVPQIVTVFNITRTSEQNATRLVDRWQYIADKLDENLSIRLFLRSVRSPVGNRTISASFTSLYLGGVSDLLPIMQREFPELELSEQDCTEMSWIESTLFFAGAQNQFLDVLLGRVIMYNATYFKAKSDFVRHPIPVHGLRGMWRFLHEETENMAEIQFSPYGGALSTFPESETPFPHRAGTLFMIQYAILWDKQGDEEFHRHIDWIRRFYSYMAPYVSQSPRAAYFNYRDLDLGTNNQGNTSYEQASIWGRRYFKNNFGRLVRVKTQFDPFNLFRNEQSIPVVSPGSLEER